MDAISGQPPGRLDTDAAQERNEAIKTGVSSTAPDEPATDAPAGQPTRLEVDSLPLEVDDDADQGDFHVDAMSIMPGGSRYRGVSSLFMTERPFEARTLNSSTRSLFENELPYVDENGRRYCGSVLWPNDKEEQNRMYFVHQVFLWLLDGQLTTVPLDAPTMILDIGTGTGDWAIDMSEQFPNCQVLGNDLSDIQPSSVPHNCEFEVDDCEEEWLHNKDSVDLVHFRNMADSVEFTKWRYVYEQAFGTLKPGGYIELLDYYSDEAVVNSLPADCATRRLSDLQREALVLAGRRRGIDHLNPALLEAAGFVDIQEKDLDVPLYPRIEGGPLSSKAWLLAALWGIEASALRLLTQYLGWDAAVARELIREVTDEMKSMAEMAPEGQVMCRLRILTARRPQAPPELTFADSASARGYLSVDDSTGGDGSTIGGSTVASTIGAPRTSGEGR